MIVEGATGKGLGFGDYTGKSLIIPFNAQKNGESIRRIHTVVSGDELLVVVELQEDEFGSGKVLLYKLDTFKSTRSAKSLMEAAL